MRYCGIGVHEHYSTRLLEGYSVDIKVQVLIMPRTAACLTRLLSRDSVLVIQYDKSIDQLFRFGVLFRKHWTMITALKKVCLLNKFESFLCSDCR